MADREEDLSEEEGNENMADEYPVDFRQGLFNDESEVRTRLLICPKEDLICIKLSCLFLFFQDVQIPMMMDYDMEPYQVRHCHWLLCVDVC